MKDIKIGFIGAGNMGSAILKGICRSGEIKSENIRVYDIKRPENLPSGVLYADFNSCVEQSDYILIAVKPNVFPKVLEDIKKLDYKDKVFISIAAGITVDFIKGALGDVKVVRAMPNLPLCVGEGMTVVSVFDGITDDEMCAVKCIFESSGKMCVLPEDYINKCLSINGSGPAYVFMFIEALADAACKNGVARNDAYTLAAQTVLGSAKMVLETGIHPGALKDMVCSPAGTTIEAVVELEKKGFRNAIIEASDRCTEKAISMSKKQ